MVRIPCTNKRYTMLIQIYEQEYYDIVLLQGILQHVSAITWQSSGRHKQEYNYDYKNVITTSLLQIAVIIIVFLFKSHWRCPHKRSKHTAGYLAIKLHYNVLVHSLLVISVLIPLQWLRTWKRKVLSIETVFRSNIFRSQISWICPLNRGIAPSTAL
jgi:lipoprotein signal peptidase